MPTKKAGDQEVLAFVMRKDTTHGTAPEASAARAILLLQAAYPTIQTGVLTAEQSLSTATKATPSRLHQTSAQAQASLVAYLSHMIKDQAPKLTAAERDNPNIAATIRMVQYIVAAPGYSPDDKKRVFKQMKSIASTCPGLFFKDGVDQGWDANHQLWSTNRLYQADTACERLIIASPAETLNLTCRALFDDSRYIPSDSGSAQDLSFRVASFFNTLLKLEQQVASGQFQKCSAGRQHDLLFLLNHAYLQQPTAMGGEPIELIEDISTFLFNCLSSYVEKKLLVLSLDARSALMLTAAKWQAELITCDESPLLTWLREENPATADAPDAAWKRECKAFIAERCEAFGLNPAGYDIVAYIDQLPLLTIPTTSLPIMSLMVDLLATKPLPLPSELTASTTSMHTLMAARNAALAQLQSITPPLLQSTPPEAIQAFFSTLPLVNSLYHYRHLTVFIGAEEEAFKTARQTLQRALLTYYTGYTVEKQLPPDFAALHSDYLAQEKAFINNPHVSFIENFFASLQKNGANWEASWDRLLTLKPATAAIHPVSLSDETLMSWHAQQTSVDEDGRPIVDLSPYQINRILLHALLIHPNNWTKTFCEQALLPIVQWLSDPETPEDSLPFNTFKQAYPRALLNNLFLAAYLSASSLPASSKTYYLSLFQPLYTHNMVYRYARFWLLLKASRTIEESQQLLAIMGDKLGTFIQNGHGLLHLLELPTDILTEAQRDHILTTVQPQLSLMIQNGEQLLTLFQLDSLHLNRAQQAQILTSLRESDLRVDLLLDLQEYIDKADETLKPSAQRSPTFWQEKKSQTPSQDAAYGLAKKIIALLADPTTPIETIIGDGIGKPSFTHDREGLTMN